MKLAFAIIVALSLIASAFAAGTCYKGCRFHFCDGTTKFNPKAYKPDTPFMGQLCDKRGKIRLGVVAQAGEGIIWYKFFLVPISKYRRAGLKQHFSPSFFKTFPVGGYHGGIAYGKFVPLYFPHKLSSVGRETSQQSQINFLNHKCIVLPLKNYQVLDRNGRYVIKNINVGPKRALHDCVAFKVVFGRK